MQCKDAGFFFNSSNIGIALRVLAGWSRSKSCSKWLNVQVETSDEWHSSGVGTRQTALFNIFVDHMDSGTERTLSKFTDDTKLCGVISKLIISPTLKGRNDIQRNAESLERWTCVNLMKFNKAKCKVPHVGCCRRPHLKTID